MTPADFRAARLRLGLTQAETAEKLGVRLRTIQGWEGATRRIPQTALLLLLVLLRNENPPAVVKKKRGRPKKPVD